MTRPQDREAWAQFWRTSPGSSGSGCLPNALKHIDAAQSQFWHAFALALPKRARVLDIATGDGVVLRRMAQVRPDLRLTGADSSPHLPPAQKGVTLKAGVPMERLGFQSGSFDAVTSQFGFEYGDTALGSAEVARVLKTGGKIRFMLHHRSGPILAHNLPRREALLWATRQSGYLPKAHALVAARANYQLPTPPVFRTAPAQATQLFPTQSVAAEFLTALLQILVLSEGRPAREAQDALRELEDKALNEIARISSLERSACDQRRIEDLLQQLSSAGLEITTPEQILDHHSRRPFAWAIAGTRQPD